MHETGVLLALPRNVGLREGALAEPLAVIFHSMKSAAPQTGETALVYGAGPIGLLTIAALKLARRLADTSTKAAAA